MSYIRKTTAKRPAGVQWFARVNPEMHKADMDFVAAQPGFISYEREFLDKDTVVTIITFDTEENFDAMVTARKLTPAWQARVDYNNANGIVRTAE